VSHYRTYNWAVEAPKATGDPRLDSNPFFDDRVHAAVEKALATRGFEKADSAAAQLLLHYHVSITQEIDLGAADADLTPHIAISHGDRGVRGPAQAGAADAAVAIVPRHDAVVAASAATSTSTPAPGRRASSLRRRFQSRARG